MCDDIVFVRRRLGSMDPPLAPAALWRRVVARVLDWAAMWALFFAMQVTGVSFWARGDSSLLTPTPWGVWFLPILTVAALLAVLEITYTAVLGQTPGKDLLGIRVDAMQHADPKRVAPVVRAFTRWLLPGIAIALPITYAVVALGAIGAPALFDEHRRSLADRLARTRVVSNGSTAREPSESFDTHLIRFGMEKWLGGVTGDRRVLPLPETTRNDDRTLAD